MSKLLLLDNELSLQQDLSISILQNHQFHNYSTYEVKFLLIQRKS